MTGLIDFFIFSFLLFVAFLGASRGLVRSFLNLAAWIGASAITALARPALALFFHGTIEEPIVADILSVVLPFVVSLVLLQVLFGLFPKYTHKFFPQRWDHILGLVFGLTLGVLILTFSWTFAVAVAPFITEQEALARSRGVQLVRVLSVPSRGFLNRFLPREYQLPDTQEEAEPETEKSDSSATRTLQLEDGTRIVLPAPAEDKRQAPSLYDTNLAGAAPTAEVQRIQEALDALLKTSGSVTRTADTDKQESAGQDKPNAQEETLSTAVTTLPALVPNPVAEKESTEDFAALRRLNKLLEEHEKSQDSGGNNSLVPDLPQFTREDLPAVQNPEAERHIQQLLQGLEGLRALQ